MSALDELSQALTSVSAAIAPSVVGIGSRLRGSGVVAADGQVLTNAHNVRGDQVTVTFAGGRTAIGTVAGVDVDGDLAVIAVETAGASAVPWADGSEPAVGSNNSARFHKVRNVSCTTSSAIPRSAVNRCAATKIASPYRS